MESASTALSSSVVHPALSPFDPYQDPFEATTSVPNRRGSVEDTHPESWSSGGNNAHSPLDQSGNPGSVNGNSGKMDIVTDAVSAQEQKKKRFVCPHCTRTFARSGHLQRHERSRMSFLCFTNKTPMNAHFNVRSVHPRLVD